MSRSVRRFAIAAVGIGVGFLAAIQPAQALRRCTNAELQRISEAWIIDCTAKPKETVQCSDNGDPVCCYYTPWGTKCTSSPGATSFDPDIGTDRPPRAGLPTPPPSRVAPPPNTPAPPRQTNNPDRAGPSMAPAKTPAPAPATR